MGFAAQLRMLLITEMSSNGRSGCHPIPSQYLNTLSSRLNDF
jgi:hypothetical protein